MGITKLEGEDEEDIKLKSKLNQVLYMNYKAENNLNKIIAKTEEFK